MSLSLDNQEKHERSALFVGEVRPDVAIPPGLPAIDKPPGCPADDQRRAIDSRIVLGGCGILLSLVALQATLQALELRPPSECRVSPLRPAFGGETSAIIDAGSGAACAVAADSGVAMIEDLSVTSPPRHGTIAPRGRTGVIYRSQGKYRGRDSFELALRGRSETQAGIAIVRVRVNIR